MQLEIDRLDGFEFSTEIAAQHGAGISKSIRVVSLIADECIDITFVVINHRKEVCRTVNLSYAVNAFNDIK